MNRYINSVEKLAPNGSTQQNESFNHRVALKCPKSKHFSGSQSFSFRVAAAVNTKNIGYTYINEVYKKANFSPTKSNVTYRQIKEQKMAKKKLFEYSPAGKIKRKALKKSRASKASKNKQKEGLTYESDVGLSGILELAIETPSTSVCPTVLTSYQFDSSIEWKIMYVDTETTGFSVDKDQVCQIAAYDGECNFNVHIVPTVSIKLKASIITGLTVNNGNLFCRDNKLATVSRESAILQFIEFLESHKSTEPNIILVGHNIIKFDALRIEKLTRQFGLYERFTQVVYGYSDTLDVLKKKLPERVQQKLSFSETNLVKDYLPQENIVNLHDALQDIKTLKKLIEYVGVTDKEIINQSKSLVQLQEAAQFRQQQ
ncbi:uncharacterized protein LOC131672566 [Phymastichus coffea]|uniref:uncharacterized protein LOC131672566 n=1 Tax=Phymastichus coffea TaxID=108790 RepID=UPI00273AAC88|nr:uncharacterized protein LOC131672566 [Phymastichus coffea]